MIGAEKAALFFFMKSLEVLQPDNVEIHINMEKKQPTIKRSVLDKSVEEKFQVKFVDVNAMKELNISHQFQEIASVKSYRDVN